MSERLAWFRSPGGITAVALPFSLDEILADWASLRVAMARNLPAAFERDEWAYLISFVDESHLNSAFVQSFGTREAAPGGKDETTLVVRPLGTVAVWLPNNVSLLGPLTMILLSITGNRILLKGGSRSDDLTGVFLNFALEHLREGALKQRLREAVRFEVFDRNDERNAEYARNAQARIVFGSDAAAAAIDALDHPRNSVGFDFIDRRSEAWVERECLSDDVVDVLIKVFAIYGQAGCTSPRRVVVLDGSEADARELRDRMLERWPHVIARDPAPHVASACVMARQWAAALGWDARLAARNGAVLATGDARLDSFDASMGLPVVCASRADAKAMLPENIQTVGHAVRDAGSAAWLEAVADSRIKRFVPVARMHHFGPVWDGVSYWRRTFEDMEAGS